MGSAYGIADCIGWYLANAGVYNDAGTTPAQDGDPIAQWADQSGAGNPLTQTNAAARPLFNLYATRGGGAVPATGTPATQYGVDQPAGVCFNGRSTSLAMPSSLSVAGGQMTVLLCTRGAGVNVLGLGSLSYGTAGDAGTATVAAADGTLHTSGVPLPLLLPTVHGFTASSQAVVLWTAATPAATPGIAIPATNAGVLGRATDPSAPGFSGEVLELAVFDRALQPAEVQTVVAGMQSSNGLHATGPGNLLLLIGDEQIAGDPAAPFCRAMGYWLARSESGAYQPFQTAVASATCASQLTKVQPLTPSLNIQPFAGRVAVLCCGVNDVLNDGCDGATLIARFAALVQAVRAIPAVRVIAAVPLLAAGVAGETQQAAIDAFRTWLRTDAGRLVDGVVDWTADPMLADDTPLPLFRTGAVLSTETGSRRKAAAVQAVLDAPSAVGAVSNEELSFGSFYGATRSFAGSFGSFVRA